MRNVIIILGVVIVGLGIVYFIGRDDQVSIEPESTLTPQVEDNTLQDSKEDEEETMTITELEIEDVEVGEGDEAVTGKKVTVHYVGTLQDSTKFDSSRDRGEPFEFSLGAGQVIAGWDQGVAGMKVGGVRKLIIPPDLGYGERGAGVAIPPNSVLVFEIELLSVE